MTTSLQSFRLYVEHVQDPTAAANSPLELTGAASLEFHDTSPALVAGRQPGMIIFEPIAGQPQPLVAMTAPEGMEVRVNGLAAGPFHVLTVKDTIELAGGKHVLHLTLFQQPYAGLALEEHAGRECPICLTPIGREDHVLVCVHCQAVMHLGPDVTESAGEQLECARTTSLCPCCNQRLAREEGYVYVPEL